MHPYRFYFDKDLNYLLQEELELRCEYLAIRYAKQRLRMYANLFSRGIRKTFTEDSCCTYCGSKEKIQVDHITPIAKGGKNELENTQILCRKCNREKSHKVEIEKEVCYR